MLCHDDVQGLLFLYVGRVFVSIGHQRQMTNGGDIYRYLCGPIVGRFFDYFSVLFIALILDAPIQATTPGAKKNPHKAYGDFLCLS
ncbi:MAG: hypothetical protein KA214_06410 [Neisseriaceae bacterium]|nr:hypothetical protein [Neisseriaceae bacterium]